MYHVHLRLSFECDGANKNQHQEWLQRETIHDEFAGFAKLGKKKFNRVSKILVCLWDMCWRNFCVFSLVTKKRGKVGQKLPFLKMRANLKEKKTITFFRRMLSKLHKEDTLLYVTVTFSLKQGETRTSSGPISLPLRCTGSVTPSHKPIQAWVIVSSLVTWNRETSLLRCSS